MQRLRSVVATIIGAMLGLGLFLAGDAWTQTNPTAQSLPYTQDFSGLAHSSTTYPAGWQGWELSTSGSSTSFRTNAPTADKALLASSSASTTTGGVHNYNGKIGILASGSTDPALALAITTTGHSNVTVAFDIMTIRNPYDGGSNTRINQVDLQYRVGTSGSFTSVSGSASGIYESNTTAQTGSGVTTPQNLQAKTFTLPSACDNQATVQLRWVQRDVSGSFSRPSFAVDNISVCPGVGAAGTITGSTSVCANATGVSYSISAVSGATTYTWTVPSGASVASGQGTTSITVDWGATSGNVTVTPSNSCNTGTANSLAVTVNPLPIVTFSSVGPFLVTDAAVDLSPSVSPSGGTFSGAGISGTMFDPATAGVGEHGITYSFTDGGTGCTKSVTVKITVNPVAPPPAAKSFVLLAETDIQINGQVNSDGDMHANNDIFFNQGKKPNSVHTGNVTASDDIFIKKNNKIVGTVMGDDVENSGTVTGGVTEDAGIAKVPLPVLASLDHGDDNVTVKAGTTLTLAPGDYAEVKVGKKGTLNLSSGTYNLECLNLREKAMLVIDLTSGLPITINADEEVIFGKNVVMKLVPASASTDLITINCDEDDDSDQDFDDNEDDTDRVIIGEGARVFGNIIAPETMVVLDKKSRFKGAICAENVLALNGARFVHHSSVASFPKESEADESDESEVAESEVITDYVLEQNYPNPFSQIPRLGGGNPSTAIAFTLPEAGKVTLSIYALTGQLVATLVDGELPAGHHQLSWNGRNQSGQIAAGMYLYRLIVTDHDGSAIFTQTRRMTLLK